MNYLLFFLFILPTIVIITWISFASGIIAVIEKDIEKWAQLGDFFGGTLNPIFAYLALLALLYTIKLQSDALKMSKDELEATRNELKESRIAQQEQSKSLELQNEATKIQIFENTFFQLNELFINTKNNIHINVKFSSPRLTINENTFNYFASYDDEYIREQGNFVGNYAIKKLLIYFKTLLKLDYEEFNNNFENETGSYFAQMYQLIKFIDESDISNKYRYINIFRSQLTKEELELLFFYCLGKIGQKKFKKFVEKYEFFEHIILNEDFKFLLLSYEISAFGKNEMIIDEYKNLYESTKSQ